MKEGKIMQTQLDKVVCFPNLDNSQVLFSPNGGVFAVNGTLGVMNLNVVAIRAVNAIGEIDNRNGQDLLTNRN
jgi:hypothetical protein